MKGICIVFNDAAGFAEVVDVLQGGQGEPNEALFVLMSYWHRTFESVNTFPALLSYPKYRTQQAQGTKEYIYSLSQEQKTEQMIRQRLNWKPELKYKLWLDRRTSKALIGWGGHWKQADAGQVCQWAEEGNTEQTENQEPRKHNKLPKTNWTVSYKLLSSENNRNEMSART